MNGPGAKLEAPSLLSDQELRCEATGAQPTDDRGSGRKVPSAAGIGSRTGASHDSLFGARYRKKPVEIKAIQWDGQNYGELKAFVGESLDEAWSVGGYCFINTLEGRMNAAPGDWIIRGVKGEFYPCKPDIFEASYEGPWVTCSRCGGVYLERHEDGHRLYCDPETVEADA